MKKITLTLSTLIMVAAITFAGPGMGGIGGPHHGMQMGDGHMVMMLHMLDNEELNLSEQQQQQIAEIIEKEALWSIDHRASVEKLELKMQILQLEDDPDISALERNIDQLAATRAEGRKRHMRTRLQITELLDDDQQETMKKLMHKRRHKMDGRPGPDRIESGRRGW